MKRSVPLVFSVSITAFFVSLLVLIFARRSTAFARNICASVALFFKETLLAVSNLIPFSLYELLLASAPIILVALFFGVVLQKGEKALVRRRFLKIISIFLLLSIVYIFAFSVGFFTSNVPDGAVSADELSSAMKILSFYIKKNVPEKSVSLDMAEEKLYLAYSRLEYEDLFFFTLKPHFKALAFSSVFSKLGILANYSFFTSEINLNTEAPLYTLLFSASHEMAHLYGVSGEGKADFYAYLACVSSGEAYLCYSAYLNAFEYLYRELSFIDKKLADEIFLDLPAYAKEDVASYLAYYRKNSGNARKASAMLNETVLSPFLDRSGVSYDSFTVILTKHILSSNENLSTE